jgi:hypothetical protein
LTWAGLVVVPALVIVALGSGVLPALFDNSAASAPGGLLLAETRDFTFNGDDLASLSASSVAPGQHTSINQFMDTWQNTVRRPPSPRR